MKTLNYFSLTILFTAHLLTSQDGSNVDERLFIGKENCDLGSMIHTDDNQMATEIDATMSRSPLFLTQEQEKKWTAVEWDRSVTTFPYPGDFSNLKNYSESKSHKGYSGQPDSLRIKIKDVGYITLSHKLKVSEDINLIENNQYEASYFVLEPRSDISENIGTYARVVLETAIGNGGDFENIASGFRHLSSDEIYNLDVKFKSSTKRGLSPNNEFVKWYPLKTTEINGMNGLHYKYIRKLGNNNPVLVQMYLFPNYDRRHILTITYRLSHQKYWEYEMNQLLNSLIITNVAP